MSGASLGKVFGTLPCFATSFDAGADVGLEFTFFGCRATCRRTASLCRAVALCGAVPRASGGFQTSEYVPAPKAVGASAAVNNASPSLRTLSPLPSGLQNGFANAPQAFEGSGLTGPTTRARPAPLTLRLKRRNFQHGKARRLVHTQRLLFAPENFAVRCHEIPARHCTSIQVFVQ